VQGPAFKAKLSEIVEYTRIWGGDIRENVKSSDKAFNLGTAFVDSTFFKVFSFPLLFGNPSTVLTGMYSVVVTEETALKFFGTTNVIGRRLK
jgi:putative ABC transport system permease protein